MKVESLKRLPVILISVTVMAASTGIAMADTPTKPYIKAFGGDVMSGGWFSDGNNCSTATSSNYQDPSFSMPGYTADSRTGGILTYTKTSNQVAGGSSSQYGAVSLGEVDGSGTGNGFYSDGAQASGSDVKNLTFANSGNGLSYGGEYEGSVRQSNCIPDYYAKKPSTTLVNNISEAISQGSGDYNGPSGGTFDLTNGGATRQIPAGQRIAIYVDGNVYIDRNIVYDPTATVDNVPKFALIVKGSIYIDKGVTELDGLYVAQPAGKTATAVSADDGDIWTCYPSTKTKPDYTFPPTCTAPLVVNGALIAKQINFLRVNGDVGAANSNDDKLGIVDSCAGGSCNLSEVVNYTPDMIMGGNFFSSGGTSSSGGLPIDSVISLPPVF